ncbi:shikimate dehydrogenase [Flavobacteriaceae bacterium AH-315-B10]|nr:shikimate dehydrogenase [Flavobacteriaceae bacterium AH-315-B10]
MSKFGLIGKNIEYSFSKSYFTNKFESEGLSHTYQNFDIESIDKILDIIKSNQDLIGLNVTIPYKEEVIPYLDKLDSEAEKIGAVNTIKIAKDGKLIGYNTDYYGFQKSIKPYLKPNHKKALVLGTGGASKAIAFALKNLGIECSFVSRTDSKSVTFTYQTLTENVIENHHIIINCTPIGTYPNTNTCPPIPYDAISNSHLLYDLIYNPEETKFLTIGRLKSAKICNGLEMLELQADKAWEIWQ